jgi:DNA repair protein RadC
MKVPILDMMVNEKRLPYLEAIAETEATDDREYSTPEAIAETLRTIYRAEKLPEERVWMISFDNRLQMTGIFEISRGTVNYSAISQTQILQRALLSGAVCIAMAHNHPSGDTEPSREDEKITKDVAKGAKLCGIKLIDHIIIAGAGRNSFYSFRQAGKL